MEASYIKKPNLTAAIVVGLLVVLLSICYSNYVIAKSGMSYADIFYPVYLPFAILNMLMLYMFGEYLKEAGLGKAQILILVIVFTLFVQTIISIFSVKFFSEESYRLRSLLIFAGNLLTLLRACLYLVLGFMLLAFKGDRVGGLVVVGVLCFLTFFALILGLVQVYYTMFLSINAGYSRSMIDSDILYNVMNILGEVTSLFHKMSIVYVFYKAYRYNKALRPDRNNVL